MTNDPMRTIEMAQAEVKFYKARVALLEAAQAYRAITASTIVPVTEAEDRARILALALHNMSTSPGAGEA